MPYTPWDEVAGGRVTPTPVTPTPAPVVVTPTTPTRWTSIIAATIVGVSVLGGGWLLSRNKNPSPSPQPVPAPNVPVVDTTLSKLLPSDEARSQASSFFRDAAYFVERQQNLKTSDDVVLAIQNAVQMLQQTNRLTGMAAVNAPISDRIIRALGGQPATGVPSVPLDQALPSGVTPRSALQREYQQISVDLRG